MSTSSPAKPQSKFFRRPFSLWGGRFGKSLDFWNKHQKWWWFSIFVVTMVWFSFDVGRVVARIDLMSGSQNVQGVVTLSEALTKSEGKGGRLIITSSTDARFIDNAGQTWNIPNFAKNATQTDMERFEKNGVGIDGKFNIVVNPVKTRPNEILISTASDVLMRLLIISLYAFVFYLIMRHLAGQKKGRFSKIESETNVKTKIKDVAGYEGVKEELFEIVNYLKEPDRYNDVGAKVPQGVLLYGPPGTGKTLLAKAVAGEAAASFFEQTASSFVQVFAGEGAKAVRLLFDEARKAAPSVIFIDEIDAVGGARSAGSHDERIQTLNAILTEMSGFKENEGVVVIAATNRLETLDDALKRSGRFDRKVWIGLPSTSDREKILQIHSQNIKCSSEVDWGHWAAQTKGFAGADLAALINEAAIEAARERQKEVQNIHIEKARDRVMIGARNHGQVLSDHEREIVSVHELGHAWMRLHTGGRVEKVSISPRGQSLGVTVSVAGDEKFLHTKEDILKELYVLMGGRAAEQVVFGHVTGGAIDDMQRASELARDVVIRLGSDKFGPYIPSASHQGSLEEEAASLLKEAYEYCVTHLSKQKDMIVQTSVLLQSSEELSEKELINMWNNSFLE